SATLAFSSGGTGFASNAGTFLLRSEERRIGNNAFTNSGTFQLSGNAALTITGDYANSGTLNLDTNLDGGGSLTIGGTLNNTKTVAVGGNALSAATSLTLGGPSNPCSARFLIRGSSSHSATLAFSSGGTGFASNAGTFLL